MQEIPDCGHPECQEAFEHWKLAQGLGFQSIAPGVMGFYTDDPERAIAMIRAMTGGVDELARDIVAQSEEIARRAADIGEAMHQRRWYAQSREELETSMDINKVRGGRHAMRKVGRRSFFTWLFNKLRGRK